MPVKPPNRHISRWLQSLFGRSEASGSARGRGPVTHVIIIDGTMASLTPGNISNAGITFGLLKEMGASVSVYYQPGIQWSHWRRMGDVITGRGINRQIRRAYGYLASRYRPGDRIFLLGYSRGAYAVRSLAGVIDQVGLLRREDATHRNVRDIYRHYQSNPSGACARSFAAAHCHNKVQIDMIGAWDTVKSLGLNLPFIWRFSLPQHDFHNHQLGGTVKHGFQALALNERRTAYEPVMWESNGGWDGHVEQVWFRGCHGDIGGQLGGFEAARGLANIPLVWMLDKAETCGMPLPRDWRTRFPQDPGAPSVGTFRGVGRWLFLRAPRRPGCDASERTHASARVTPARRGWLDMLWFAQKS